MKKMILMAISLMAILCGLTAQAKSLDAVDMTGLPSPYISPESQSGDGTIVGSATVSGTSLYSGASRTFDTSKYSKLYIQVGCLSTYETRNQSSNTKNAGHADVSVGGYDISLCGGGQGGRLTLDVRSYDSIKVNVFRATATVYFVN